MECQNCACEYDNDRIIARIIIDCGHNMCEFCIREFCVRGHLYCTECGKNYPPRMINEYPKNIAIKSIKANTSLRAINLKRFRDEDPETQNPGVLYYKNSNSASERKENSDKDSNASDLEINYDQLKDDSESGFEDTLDLNLEDETMNFTLNCEKELIDILTDNNSNRLCVKHNKQVEAFCTDDYKIICINCILEDGYQNKNITSLAKALEIEKGKLQVAMKNATKYENKLIQSRDSILKYSQNLRKHKNKSLMAVENVYDGIVKKIIKLKNQRINEVKHTYESEISKCNDKLQQMEEQNKNISVLKSIAIHESKSEGLSCLANAQYNQDMMAKCEKDITGLKTMTSLKQTSKDFEMSKIAEVLMAELPKLSASQHAEAESPKTAPLVKSSQQPGSKPSSRRSSKVASKRDIPKPSTHNIKRQKTVTAFGSRKSSKYEESTGKLSPACSSKLVKHKFQSSKPTAAKNMINLQKVSSKETKEVAKPQLVDYKTRRAQIKQNLSQQKESKYESVKKEDHDSNSSRCETVKFTVDGIDDMSSVYSVADSTVIISANKAAPQLPNSRMDTTPWDEKFQTQSYINIESPVKVPRLDFGPNNSNLK